MRVVSVVCLLVAAHVGLVLAHRDLVQDRADTMNGLPSVALLEVETMSFLAAQGDAVCPSEKADASSKPCCAGLACPFEGGSCCEGNTACCPAGTTCTKLDSGVACKGTPKKVSVTQQQSSSASKSKTLSGQAAAASSGPVSVENASQKIDQWMKNFKKRMNAPVDTSAAALASAASAAPAQKEDNSSPPDFSKSDQSILLTHEAKRVTDTVQQVDSQLQQLRKRLQSSQYPLGSSTDVDPVDLAVRAQASWPSHSDTIVGGGSGCSCPQPPPCPAGQNCPSAPPCACQLLQNTPSAETGDSGSDLLRDLEPPVAEESSEAPRFADKKVSEPEDVNFNADPTADTEAPLVAAELTEADAEHPPRFRAAELIRVAPAAPAPATKPAPIPRSDDEDDKQDEPQLIGSGRAPPKVNHLAKHVVINVDVDTSDEYGGGVYQGVVEYGGSTKTKTAVMDVTDEADKRELEFTRQKQAESQAAQRAEQNVKAIANSKTQYCAARSVTNELVTAMVVDSDRSGCTSRFNALKGRMEPYMSFWAYAKNATGTVPFCVQAQNSSNTNMRTNIVRGSVCANTAAAYPVQLFVFYAYTELRPNTIPFCVRQAKDASKGLRIYIEPGLASCANEVWSEAFVFYAFESEEGLISSTSASQPSFSSGASSAAGGVTPITKGATLRFREVFHTAGEVTTVKHVAAARPLTDAQIWAKQAAEIDATETAQ